MNENIFPLRNEAKYIITYTEFKRLKNILESLLIKDSHSDGSYIIKSLYFDSINNNDYLDKLAGVDKRQKIRIRFYSNDTCKFELKEKVGNQNHKEFVFLKYEDALKISDGEYNILLKYINNNPKLLNAYYLMKKNCYVPKSIVKYQRYAYEYPNYFFRITFDTDIRFKELAPDYFSESGYLPLIESKVIMEIKYKEKIPDFLTNILKRYQKNKISYSKYCESRKNFNRF